MKKLVAIMILAIVLTGCGAKTLGNPETKSDVVPSVTLKPGEEVYVQKSGNNTEPIEFNGFVSQIEDSWVVSFSDHTNSAVNEYFIVQEGSVVKFNGAKFAIFNLEPFKNEITINTLN